MEGWRRRYGMAGFLRNAMMGAGRWEVRLG